MMTLSLTNTTNHMKTLQWFLTLAVATTTHQLKANNNDICDTRLFKQLVNAEKSGIERPALKPSKSLNFLISEYEILCPMQVERDFNGDNQIDWVGIIKQNGQFHLSAYLSGKNQYRLVQIKQYKTLPNNQYLEAYTEKKLRESTGVIGFAAGVKYAVVENKLGNENSVAYIWNGKTLEKLAEFKFVPNF
ncbi:hypothetical protein [Aliikangiella coralliicola]|uniref:Uncharacterized protein n=1 Tax=Aliikangiella coralliicola TaxID=2592383 RepID=A0A545UA97_9GAMM|nr:hypothetical protein [Aliikangiella coralliicola]TQV86394.1 hypothetical protein FLL46_15860 [Aliikangiella coralliicola]